MDKRMKLVMKQVAAGAICYGLAVFFTWLFPRGAWSFMWMFGALFGIIATDMRLGRRDG